MNNDMNLPETEIVGDGTKNAPISVSQLNEYIKAVIDSDSFLNGVYVKGEISNFTNHYKTGHFYFSLKDDGGVIKAVMFKSSASKLKFVPENGMKVVIRGRISLFVRDGQYQLYADSMEPEGIGALYLAFEQLKRKLESEGLFSENRKKSIPKIPTRLGVITAPTGAAIKDIINISGRRFPYAKIILYPSLVQGADAPPQLIAGLEYFNRTKSVDVIIIGRGGGSIEDLWAFNDENVARAVSASEIPVISAVGHEIDFTICDFVSDKRAPTPSAAAEIALPETNELKRKINNIISREQALLEQMIKNRRNQIERYGKSYEPLINQILKNRRNQIERYEKSRALTNPMNSIDDRRMAIVALSDRLEKSMSSVDLRCRSALKERAAKLEALSPLSVLSRGYSAVFDTDGKLIKSVCQLSLGDKVRLRAADGIADAEIINTEKYETGE